MRTGAVAGADGLVACSQVERIAQPTLRDVRIKGVDGGGGVATEAVRPHRAPPLAGRQARIGRPDDRRDGHDVAAGVGGVRVALGDGEVADDGRVIDLDEATRGRPEAIPGAVVVALGDVGVVGLIAVQDGRVGTTAAILADLNLAADVDNVGAEAEEVQADRAAEDLGVIPTAVILLDFDVAGQEDARHVGVVAAARLVDLDAGEDGGDRGHVGEHSRDQADVADDGLGRGAGRRSAAADGSASLEHAHAEAGRADMEPIHDDLLSAAGAALDDGQVLDGGDPGDRRADGARLDADGVVGTLASGVAVRQGRRHIIGIRRPLLEGRRTEDVGARSRQPPA